MAASPGGPRSRTPVSDTVIYRYLYVLQPAARRRQFCDLIVSLIFSSRRSVAARLAARALEPPGAPADHSRRRSSFWPTSDRPLAPAGPTCRAQPPPPPPASRTCSYESCGGAVDGLPNSQARTTPPRRRKGRDVRRAPERVRGVSGLVGCARACRACRNIRRAHGSAGRRASTPQTARVMAAGVTCGRPSMISVHAAREAPGRPTQRPSCCCMQPGPCRWTARLPLGGPLGRSEPDLSRQLLATPMELDHESGFAARRSTSSVWVRRALVAPTPSAGGVRGIVRVSTGSAHL